MVVGEIVVVGRVGYPAGAAGTRQFGRCKEGASGMERQSGRSCNGGGG